MYSYAKFNCISANIVNVEPLSEASIYNFLMFHHHGLISPTSALPMFDAMEIRKLRIRKKLVRFVSKLKI